MNPSELDHQLRKTLGKHCPAGHLMPFHLHPRDCPSCRRNRKTHRRTQRRAR